MKYYDESRKQWRYKYLGRAEGLAPTPMHSGPEGLSSGRYIAFPSFFRGRWFKAVARGVNGRNAKSILGNRAIISVMLTSVIVASLLFIPSATAITVSLDPTGQLGGKTIAKGSTVTFFLDIEIASSERVPIESVAISIDGPTPVAKSFTAAGGTDAPITLTQYASLIPGQVAFGYGYGTGTLSSFGYGYGLPITPGGSPTTGYGYGYGPTGTGYGYPGVQTLRYQVVLDTSTLDPGSYTATATLTANGSTFTTITSTSFSVVAFDFSIAASPSSRSVQAGVTTTYDITASLVGADTNTVTAALSVSVSPTSVGTLSFSPSTVTPTGSSTLTVVVSSAAEAGTYTLTITGTGGSVTQTTTVTLTVSRVTAALPGVGVGAPAVVAPPVEEVAPPVAPALSPPPPVTTTVTAPHLDVVVAPDVTVTFTPPPTLEVPTDIVDTVQVVSAVEVDMPSVEVVVDIGATEGIDIPSDIVTTPVISASVPSITPSAPALIPIPIPGGTNALTQAIIEVKTAVNGTSIKVAYLDAKPPAIATDPNGTVAKYVAVTPKNLPSAAVELILLGFQVDKSWLAEQGVTKDLVALWQYDTESKTWVRLSTAITSEDEEQVHYLATALHLSILAIAGEAPGAMPTSITKVQSLNVEGVEKTSFALGEILLPSSTVRNNAVENQTVLIVQQVFQPDLTVLPPKYVEVTLRPGETFSFQPGVLIPEDGLPGTWSVEIAVFDKFPALGGRPQSSVATLTFTVTPAALALKTDKAVYAPGDTVTIEGTTLTPESFLALQVTDPAGSSILLVTVKSDEASSFVRTFRLPTDASSGIYTVTISHEGIVKSVTFEVA